jgi:hypothetical protein
MILEAVAEVVDVIAEEAEQELIIIITMTNTTINMETKIKATGRGPRKTTPITKIIQGTEVLEEGEQ